MVYIAVKALILALCCCLTWGDTLHSLTQPRLSLPPLYSFVLPLLDLFSFLSILVKIFAVLGVCCGIHCSERVNTGPVLLFHRLPLVLGPSVCPGPM